MRKNLPDWVGLLKAERNSKKTLRCYPPEQSRLEGKSRCPPGNRNQLWRLSAWECEEVNSFILKQYFKASVMFFYWGFFLYFCKTLKRKLTFLPLSPPIPPRHIHLPQTTPCTAQSFHPLSAQKFRFQNLNHPGFWRLRVLFVRFRVGCKCFQGRRKL